MVQAGETQVANAEQFNAAVAVGGSIKLTADFDLPLDRELKLQKDLVIDLNGHTINVIKNKSICYFRISASTTIKDSVGGGKIINPNPNYGFLTNKDSGSTATISLRLEGGTLVSTGSIAVDVYMGSFTMTGGAIESTSYAIRRDAGAITISGGTINGPFTDDQGSLSITGGRFSFDPTEFLDKGYVATQDGDYWVVDVRRGPYDDYLVKANDTADTLADKAVRFNDLEWYVIADDATTADAGTVTLLAADVIASSAFDASSNAYGTSAVKSLLDDMTSEGGRFSDVADAIVETDLGDVDVTGAKLWLLSTQEAGALPQESVRAGVGSWWLRSSAGGEYASYVSVQGDITSYGVGNERGVRPALRLDLGAVDFDADSRVFSPKTPHVHAIGENDVAFRLWTDALAASQHGGDAKYTASNCLPAVPGSYYLAADVALSETWTVPTGGAVNLCLNGKRVTRAEGVDPNLRFSLVTVPAGATLSLYEDDGEESPGAVTGGMAERGGGVYVRRGGALALLGGAVRENSANFGGGVCVEGGVSADVDPVGPGTLGVSGAAVVSGNTAGTGSQEASNVLLEADSDTTRDADYNARIAIEGALGEGSSIGVSMEEPGVFTESAGTSKAKDHKGRFSSDDASYIVEVEGDELKLMLVPVEASAADVSVVYDGKAHGISVEVSDPASGATVTYGESADACTLEESPTVTNVADGPKTVYYRVSAEGRSDVTGSATITVAPLEARLTWTYTAFTYDGESHQPKATVDNLASGDECAVTVKGAKADAGTYEATATKLSNANYSMPASATQKFTIAKAKLTSIAKVADKTYTGKAIKPTPAVKAGKKTLKAGTDFTYSYKNNTKAGTATVMATGKGNYTGSVKTTFKIVVPAAKASYRAYVQGIGWMDPASGGAMLGTTGRALRLEALRLKLGDKLGAVGSIQYRAHVQTYGWQGWKADSATCGTTGQSKRLEAVQVRLTGKAAETYDVYYRVHCQTYGWMAWAKNGAKAGTAGQAKRLEAVQVVLVPKGAKASGTTYKGVKQTFGKAFV